ncbi:hypothetical protein ONS96_004726 [Cadophora gregata f. sp. sojae]|nr:hypothetical protein ONS96_004726 [Cadophora gregata f. sp. sojae]
MFAMFCRRHSLHTLRLDTVKWLPILPCAGGYAIGYPRFALFRYTAIESSLAEESGAAFAAVIPLENFAHRRFCVGRVVVRKLIEPHHQSFQTRFKLLVYVSLACNRRTKGLNSHIHGPIGDFF